jgi:hypothetical protein
MPYLLRSLTIGDVVHALRRCKPRLALCLARCLITKDIHAMRFYLRRAFLYRAAQRSS